MSKRSNQRCTPINEPTTTLYTSAHNLVLAASSKGLLIIPGTFHQLLSKRLATKRFPKAFIDWAANGRRMCIKQ